MGELIEVPYEQQLEEMKRVLVLLMASMGCDRAEFTWLQQIQMPVDATIVTWRDRMNDALVLEVRGMPPLEGVVEAEIGEEPHAIEVGNA
jgi:hypothetical protein